MSSFTFTTQDVTVWPGDTGEWKEWQNVTSSDSGLLWACGAELQVEEYVGALSDDTAVNGLRLVFCKESNWDTQTTLEIFEGRWGAWKGARLCPQNHYIDGAQVQYEDLVGSVDGTGINGLRIHCSGIGDNNGTWLDVHTGRFGNYREAVEVSGWRVIGASVRYHDPCGTTCDDTALNGLRLRFLGGETATATAPVSRTVPTSSPVVAETPSARGIPTRPPPRTTQGSSSSIVIVGVSSAVVVLLVVFSVLFTFCLCRRKKSTKTTEDARSLPQDDVESTGNTTDLHNSTQQDDTTESTPDVPAVVGASGVVAVYMEAKPVYKDQVQDIPVAAAVPTD